jgi:hypothetical protein
MSMRIRPSPRLMPSPSFVTWSMLFYHPCRCMYGFSKCHDTIVHLLDLADTISITDARLLSHAQCELHGLCTWSFLLPSTILAHHIRKLERCCTTQSMQHTTRLAISIIKHIRIWTQLGKPRTSQLVCQSFITHGWDQYTCQHDLVISTLINALTNTNAHQRRFEGEIENSHSSAQKPGKSKHKATWYEEGSWKLQVKTIGILVIKLLFM